MLKYMLVIANYFKVLYLTLKIYDYYFSDDSSKISDKLNNMATPLAELELKFLDKYPLSYKPDNYLKVKKSLSLNTICYSSVRIKSSSEMLNPTIFPLEVCPSRNGLLDLKEDVWV